MANYVASLSATMDDQLSAGAAAGAAQLSKLADAADAATASTEAVNVSATRAGASVNSLVKRYTDAGSAAAALASAQRELANAAAATDAAVASASISADQQSEIMDNLRAKVRAAQSALDAIGSSGSASASQLSGLTDSTNTLADAAGRAQQYQNALNTSLGVTASTSDGYEARALDVAAYGNELDRLRAKFDPVFAVSKRYEATLDEISAAERVGAISANTAATARDSATLALNREVEAANASAGAANGAAVAHAGFYRELVIMGHEIVTGNYSRLGGSVMVLAERSGNLDGIFKSVLGWITSMPGMLTIAGVAGVAAFTAIAVSADNQTQRLISMQEQLRATRDDYVSLGAEATAAAQGAAQQTPGLNSADAMKSAGILAASPQFAGTQQQLQNLIEISADMARVFDETVDKAAQDLANAMAAPGDAAEKSVGKLRGMSQELADQIKLQADAGDKAGAFARYLDVETAAVQGAADQLSPLRQALRDIKTAFEDTDTAGTKSGEGIGTAFRNAATYILEAVATVLKAIKDIHDITGQYLPWAKGYGNPGSSSAATVANYADPMIAASANDVGGQLGLTPDQLSLARRIILQESGGRQTNDDGSILTSRAGALGAMQVMPGTAAQYGQDPTTLAGNLSAGEQQIKRLWTKYNGDQTLVAAAYNWGEGNVDKWIAAGSDPSHAPSETTKYVQNVTGSALGSAVTGTGNSAGVANTDQGTLDQALQKASGSQAANAAELQATIDLYQKAEAEMQTTGQVGSDAWNKVDSALRAATISLSQSQDPFAKQLKTLQDQTDAQTLLAKAYGEGYSEVEKTTTAIQGYNTAVTDVGTRAPDFDASVAALADKYKALADATAAAQIAQQTLQNGTTLEYMKAETASLGTNSDARAAMLAHLKAEEDLRTHNVSALSAEGQAYLASVDDISAATAAYQQQQAALGELQNFAQTVGTSIESGLTSAFSGSGKAAASFGNIAHTVLGNLQSEVLKLAVLNPIMNSLFGGSAPTLGGVLGSLGGGGSGLGGLGSLFNGLFGGGGDGAAPIVTELAPASIPGSGLATSLPATYYNGADAAASGMSGLGAGFAGFGVGTALNGLAGGNSLGGTIGAGIGALAGSILGPLGSLAGGALGGLIGGLFGNSKPSDKTEYTHVNTATGVSTNLGNAPGSDEYNAQNVQAAANLAATIQAGQMAVSSAFNLPALSATFDAKVGSRDGDFVNIQGLGAQQHIKVATDSVADAKTLTNETVAALISGMQDTFDATTKTLLKNIDYSSGNAPQLVQQLATATNSTGQLDATQQLALPKLNTSNATSAIGELDWIKNTYEATVNGASNLGSIATQTKAVNDNFEQLVAHAQRLGLATDVLTTAQNDQIAAINTASQQTIDASSAAIQAANQQAHGDMLGSKVTAFDASGAQQLQQLTAEFKGLFGNSYTTQADYVKQVGLLTDTLAIQRADLITSQQSAMQQTIDGSAGSLLAANQQAHGDLLGSKLTAFDTASSQQQQQLTAEFKGLFGDSYTTQADYVKQVALLTDTLAQQRADLITSQQSAMQAADDSAYAQRVGVITAGWKAQATAGSQSSDLATVQWSQAVNQQADLAVFDANATTQSDSYSATLLSTFGQSYKNTADYASKMVELEQSLASQRLAIQAQYAAQAKAQQANAEQSAGGVITSLTSYVAGLASSAASPLSGQAQYAYEQQQYQAVLGSAQAGNVNSLQQLQSYAQNFLASSQNLYGSGAQYAADFNNVLQALQMVANTSQTALTQAFMQAALQSQTDVLHQDLLDLQTQIQTLRNEMIMQSLRAA